MKILSLTLALSLTAGGVLAQSSGEKAKCRIIGDAMGKASTAFNDMYKSMQGLDYSKVIPEFSGAERAAMEELAVKQAAVMGPFRDYLIALEDADLTFRRCAR